jgi:NADH-quinone oxidoreductase subunit L
MRYIWLIPVLPAIGAAINGLVGIRYFSRRTAGLVACAMMALALGVSLVAFWQLLALAPEARAFDVVVAQWIPSIPLATSSGAIGSFQVPWAFALDPLSGMMILVVTGIGTRSTYSTAHMADEPRAGVPGSSAT